MIKKLYLLNDKLSPSMDIKQLCTKFIFFATLLRKMLFVLLVIIYKVVLKQCLQAYLPLLKQ